MRDLVVGLIVLLVLQGGCRKPRPPEAPPAPLAFPVKPACTSVTLCTAACERGDAPSCRVLAERLIAGDGVPSNVQRAFELYESLCSRGDALACHDLGNEYTHSEHVVPDYGKALHLFDKSCTGRFAPACARAAALYRDEEKSHAAAAGLKPERWDAEALALDRRGCEGGDGLSCIRLAAAHGETGTQKDPAEEAKWLAKARTAYNSACERGDPISCDAAAELFSSERGGPRSAEQAAALVQRADGLFQAQCEGGDVDACDRLATMLQASYFPGRGSPQVGRITGLYERTCQLGSASDCWQGGEFRSGGVPGAYSRSVASRFYRLACERGFREGCDGQSQLAETLDEHLAAREKAAALEKAACENGHIKACLSRALAALRSGGEAGVAALEKLCRERQAADACSELGSAYAFSKWSLQKDQKRAAELFELTCKLRGGYDCQLAAMYGAADAAGCLRSAFASARRQCDAGQLYGCERLADLYRKGTGVAKDEGRASELDKQRIATLEKKCAAGENSQCESLAESYDRGTGVPPDNKRANAMWQKLCDQQGGRSCDILGDRHRDGETVGRNLGRAIKLYQRACDTAWTLSCTSLGDLYAEGKGAKKDPRRAAALYQRGCFDQDSDSCYKLAKLYQAGEGVVQSGETAQRLFKLTCDYALLSGDCRDGSESPSDDDEHEERSTDE